MDVHTGFIIGFQVRRQRIVWGKNKRFSDNNYYQLSDWLIDWLIMVCCWVLTLAKISETNSWKYTLDLSLAFRWDRRELCGETTKDSVTIYGVSCGRKPVTVLMAEFTRSSWRWRSLMTITWAPLPNVKDMDNHPGHILEGRNVNITGWSSLLIWINVFKSMYHLKYSESLVGKSRTINSLPGQGTKLAFRQWKIKGN